MTIRRRPGPAAAARDRSRALASAAGASDTISDFQFSPGTTTVKVGDTVTWTNDGPSVHTATANDGSFDTGALNKGGSASHTFNQPGTVAYTCRIHPFMHGTIVVVAASNSTPPGSSASSPSTSANSSGTTAGSPATHAGNAPGLPVTGTDVLSELVAGALLTGFGLAIRGVPSRLRRH